MRIAVAGGTGRIGRLVVAGLRERGHEAVSLSRGEGIDLLTGDGLTDSLSAAEVIVDVTNPAATDATDAEAVFTTITENLQRAGGAAGVRHLVSLSIANIDRVAGNPHYAGKRAQERVIGAGELPYSIVPATQFHDFPAMIAAWSISDGVAQVPPALLQPIAPADVAEVLIRIAEGAPVGRHVDLAGPRPEDAVDMARRTLTARGDPTPIQATWRGGMFGVEFAGEVLLPGPGARLARTTFDQWLRAEGHLPPGPA